MLFDTEKQSRRSKTRKMCVDDEKIRSPKKIKEKYFVKFFWKKKKNPPQRRGSRRVMFVASENIVRKTGQLTRKIPARSACFGERRRRNRR